MELFLQISGVLIRGDQMYEMTDVWSKIQAVVCIYNFLDST